MTINVRKLLTGGITAGAVMIVFNILAQLVLVDRLRNEMNAWSPGSADQIRMGGEALVAGVIMKLVIGIMLVWLYAALRPRFGPGIRTASYVAIFVWILGGIFFSDYLLMGMMSGVTYGMIEIIQLVALLVAVWVGARIYSEQGASGAGK